MSRAYWYAALFLFVLLLVCEGARAAAPGVAEPYRRTLIREAHYLIGIDAPIALLAGQIHQESHWRPAVCSPFACGLTQFTPSTEIWIKRAFPEGLAVGNRLNPIWAIRAMVTYDSFLYGQMVGDEECDRWAFTLSAYNGGLGWLKRDQIACTQFEGCNPHRWFDNVAANPDRRRKPQYVRENRGYPKQILFKNQWLFADWGRTVTCSAAP